MHKKDDYILQNIANHLIINCSFSKNIGLLYGTMGIIIFFYHYARYSKNRVYEEFAETLLNDFAEQIHSHLPIDFENGYLGIGWGIKYLASVLKFYSAKLRFYFHICKRFLGFLKVKK